MTTHEFIVRVNQEDDGTLWAEVLELPGCFASGDNLDELRDSLEEAISLYLHDHPDAGTIGDMKPTPDPEPRQSMTVGEMRVMVPC